MSKTRRDLLYAIAAQIGGERGRRMRDAIKHSEFPALLERSMSDEEYETQLAHAAHDLPSVLANLEELGPEIRTWNFPN